MSQWKTLARVLPVMIYKFTHNILSVEFVFQLYQAMSSLLWSPLRWKQQGCSHIYTCMIFAYMHCLSTDEFTSLMVCLIFLFSSYFISFNWWSFERDQTGFATNGTIDNQFLIPPTDIPWRLFTIASAFITPICITFQAISRFWKIWTRNDDPKGQYKSS